MEVKKRIKMKFSEAQQNYLLWLVRKHLVENRSYYEAADQYPPRRAANRGIINTKM